MLSQLQKIFQDIYEKNEWGYGSGEGFLEIQTRGYRRFLRHFLLEKKITTVVDMGCGDWQFSQFVDWSGVHYKGYDVAPVVVSTNSQMFSRPNVSFYLYSGNPTELPAADLLIVKDVLQHLPNRMIFDFLPILKQYRYALITNCTNPKNEDDVNHDIDIGGFHYLDLRKPPFNVDAQLVYTFCKNELGLKSKVKALLRGYPSWKKLVLLVKNTTSDSSPHDRASISPAPMRVPE